MPVSLPPQEHFRQCQLAAYSSRLDPNSLHILEYQHLKGRLSPAQTTLYLGIRNGILRLWTRNPLICVTREEALESTIDKRLHGLAIFGHEWLARHGYINFGCVDVYSTLTTYGPNAAKRKTVIIIGAGMSGLGCARQLQGLFAQFADRWTKVRREKLPRVVLLEGRHRIGGRIYSHPLRTQCNGTLPHNLANTAEMGAQIITGFDHGNPLDAIVRGQLALEYHAMRDNMLMYDHDGSLIDPARDAKIQALFNDLLEKASVYGWRFLAKPKVDTKPLYNDIGAKLVGDGGPLTNDLDPSLLDYKVSGKINGNMSGDTNGNTKGDTNGDVKFESSLGAFMDSLVTQYGQRTPLSQQEMRLLNWHYANLEYANAVNVDQLSLGGWDQDQGNEFEGRHSMTIGGYSQVPRALWQSPSPLDVRFDQRVAKIEYSPDTIFRKSSARVTCGDGEAYDADYVISTLPLGVLQENRIMFEPPLPSWKVGAIGRMGFGVLNKVILVFETMFWERDRDMFGLLSEAPQINSLSPQDYSRGRGKFYLFWNCVKTSGRPMLVALMAGDAARDAEYLFDTELVHDVTGRLVNMFSLPTRPVPVEAIVTRWQKDPFARGSYSYLGPDAQPGDYEAIAQPVGNLFFAGEATCGTHPATVHGAYLSGLRAASEIVEAMIGPIPAPDVVIGKVGVI